MKDCCDSPVSEPTQPRSGGFYRVLWIALIVNLAMFLVEFFFSLRGRSLSLTMDAIDFLGDSVNYGSSLLVFGASLRTRARLSMSKGIVMLTYAVAGLILAVMRLVDGALPSAETMGAVGLLALFANTLVAVLLFRFREGDSNMQSVWICTRNDVMGNLAVLVASAGVYFTGTKYPDLLVAMFLAFIGVWGATQVIRVSLKEMRR